MAPLELCITNISDGETVHQRCLLLTGRCQAGDNGEHSVSITTSSRSGIELFPEQVWPVAGSSFKTLAMLSPGSNTLKFTHVQNHNAESTIEINVTYIPLLQRPPLHLAIMVAKDSPLLIDCPSAKYGWHSSAHSGLDAAIAKLRMTAYMWQAMMAEDQHSKGLGRRTFQLEQEWAADTVSRDFLNAAHDESLALEGAMRSTAKVHIIRSSKTTKQIRDANAAQQNPNARRKEDLQKYFMDALKEAEGPFASSAHPVVAGLILDSHYSISQDLILGHAGLGCHNPDGISLGMFGSHLTYSWPRFMEEVVSCLTDTRPPGDKVGNDNGECGTMWEACTIGQGAFLHEVGLAFGLSNRPGIMERGFAQDWPKNFLAKTAYCSSLKKAGEIVSDSTPNNARWHLSNALSLQMLPHFRFPDDPLITPAVRDANVYVQVEFDGTGDELNSILRISCGAGLARVAFNDEEGPKRPTENVVRYTDTELDQYFDRTKRLSLSLIGGNGKEEKVDDVWRLVANRNYIRIPDSSIRLFKRSVYSDGLEGEREPDVYEWAQLLREKGADGNIYRATSIETRVGFIWDGGIVRYEDGHTSHWGPMMKNGKEHSFGGDYNEEIELDPQASIKRIEVNRGSRDAWNLDGVRMHLTNRTRKGELNSRGDCSIARLEPASHEVIVGFHGRSAKTDHCGVLEFGIITAPKSVGLMGLPDQTFSLPELRNTAGMDEVL